MNFRFQICTLILAAFVLFAISSCKKDPDTPEPEPDMPPIEVGTTAAEYFQTLPSWEAFAQNQSVSGPMPTGGAPTEVSETLDVPQIQEDGSIDTLYNVTYTCQQTPYTLTDNPEQIVMYSPDVEILWPGALIQGKSHKNPIGSLTGLVIKERDSINVSIPSLATGDNFRRVKPNQAVVGSAIGEMIGNATADGLSTPSTITFTMESYHSEKQMALSMGISGKYLGFSGSASGNFDRNQSETTVTVQFYQKMFEVVVEPPQSPGAFFNEDFTPAKLEEQVNLGRMGPDNLPVYVSNVVYGRMMMFSLTSTASETDIRAMLNAAYDGIGGNVKANMSAKHKSILEKGKLAVTSLGGDAEATIGMIQSGNWKDYFTNSAPLSSAAPLSYTFRNLGDGSIANITETDEYSISECTEKIGVPGVFDFFPASTYSLGDISFPVETFTADFNNDGREDIMLNHKNGTQNQIKIGYGTMEGGFDFQAAIVSSESPSDSWQSYTTHIGDVNGDQQPDIVWSSLTADANKTYFALNTGSNQFDFSALAQASQVGWTDYVLKLGDIDADGADELVWNTLLSSQNRFYTGKLNSDGSGIDQVGAQNYGGAGWSEYEFFIGNVNGGGADLIFNELYSYNHTYVALSNGDATFEPRSLSKHPVPGPGWTNYTAHTAFADNNTNTDIVLTYPSPDNNYIYVNLSNNDGSFTHLPLQTHPASQDWSDYHSFVGDVDGDGIDDLVWTNLASGTTVSHVYTALGTNSGEYDFSPVRQSNPYQTSWSQYAVQVLDINGDDKKDLLWLKPGSTTETYVALAK
ncbi:MAG: thiol-activated cytolysin family protein [Bacteroidota bacterium]